MNQICMIRNYLIFALLLISLGASAAEAATLQGRVSNVINGEQIQVIASDGRRRQVKLLGISIPTNSRQITADAKLHLSMLVAGRAVVVEYRTVAANGVILGLVRHGGADIALKMLKAGLARAVDTPNLPTETQQLYLASEAQARRLRIGLWHHF
jgi:endonuclease YncB( thermonuclease family)